MLPDSNWQTLAKAIGAKPAVAPPTPAPAPAAPRRERSLAASNVDYVKAPVQSDLLNAGRNPDAVITKFLAIDCEMVRAPPIPATFLTLASIFQEII